ncbi:hypothetical protein SBOR_8042 [Sclerotinia borealis F-4128]|uniref:DUF7708 domain-containing protein n=1 Tax=Sclerotinia borealis (strain F-4128) TaxID=1432307 RepID=W9C488_SCLBF|nr:hypothetical protein SBOR_8042 [Sclerotinia borealis F-4128]
MAAKTEDDVDNFSIVQRYSEIVRGDMQDEPLSKGLAAKVDADAERERTGNYDDPATKQLEELEAKSKELEVTWVKFKEKFKIPDDSVGVKNQKPDMNVARLAIQKAQAQIQKNQSSKFGKVKAFFRTSAQVLDSHNYLFDLLPSGEKYTSVFTGAFSSIVKATITHDDIASELSDGFDDISDQVRSFYFVIKLHPKSTYIRYHISLFYFELFGFIICLMREWYQSPLKRLSRCLGTSFLDKTVRGTLKALRQYTKRVETEDRRRQSEMNTRLLFILGATVQQSLVHQAKDSKQHDQDFKALAAYVIALHGKPGSVRNMSPHPLTTHTLIAKTQDEENHLPYFNPIPTWSRDTILADIEHLKPYLQTARDLNNLIDTSHCIEVNSEVSIRVHKWVINTSSEALWIEGPGDVSYPGQATLTSAFMLGNLRRIAIPVIVYFIKYDPRYKWDPEEELLKMIYGLLYQAAQTIPETLEPQLVDLDFSTSRLRKMKEDVAALPEALKMLTDILAIGPPLQFCIIDGLQLFDGRHLSVLVRRSIRDFVALLCRAVKDKSRKEKVFKVLFTTEGMVDELAGAAGRNLVSRETYEDEDEDEMLSIHNIV